MTMKKLLILSMFLIITLAGFSQRISELPPASSINPGDLLPIVQGGVTKKVTAGEIVQLIQDSLSNVRILSDTCIEINYHGALDTICFSGDPGLWVADGDDIENTNSGKVTIKKLYLYPLPSEATPRAIGRIAGIETDGEIKWNTPIDLFNKIQQDLDSAWQVGDPSPFAIWGRDTMQGFVYLIDTNDLVGIGTKTPQNTLYVKGSINATDYLHVGSPNSLFDVDAIGGIGMPKTFTNLLDSTYFSGKVVVDSEFEIKNTAGYTDLPSNTLSENAATIDWRTGNIQLINLTDTCTFTFTAPPFPCHLTLKIVHANNTTVYPCTWPAAVKWADGTAVTPTVTANAVDIVSFFFDGTNYNAMFGNDFK